MMLRIFVAGLAVVATAPGFAQATNSPTPAAAEKLVADADTPGLKTTADSTLVHVESKVIMPAQAASLARGAAHYYEADGNNISIPFGTPEDGTWFTLYLYRAAYPAPRLWMGPAEDQIFNHYISTRLGSHDITLGKNAAANGSMTIFQQTTPQGRALLGGMGIANLNGWLAKIRVSSTDTDAAALRQRIDRFIADISWPLSRGYVLTAAPKDACAIAHKYTKPKVLRATQTDGIGLGLSLVARLGSQDAADNGLDTPDLWPDKYCRLPDLSLGPIKLRAYQGNNATAGGWTIKYAVMIGDSGRIVEVAENALLADMSEPKAKPRRKPGKPQYVVTYYDSSGASVLALSESLLAPSYALELGLQAMDNRANMIVGVKYAKDGNVSISTNASLPEK